MLAPPAVGFGGPGAVVVFFTGEEAAADSVALAAPPPPRPLPFFGLRDLWPGGVGDATAGGGAEESGEEVAEGVAAAPFRAGDGVPVIPLKRENTTGFG